MSGTMNATSFGFMAYAGEPVLSQRSVGHGLIEVTFYDQPDNRSNPQIQVVTESEWNSFSKRMLMPREHGRRAHVLRNWHQYQQYAREKE